MSFLSVKQLIKAPDEIHERKGLADWIQREAIDTHADSIANYIRSNDQRFLGALVIGVYDGDPNWIPLNVNFSSDLVDVSEESRDHITGKLGLLKLSGSEKLFAIDGQHRVAGIKKALESGTGDISDSDEEVTAIFVSHNGSTDEGKQRTRRLFTTLNKEAKRISKAAKIALDEDNGFAIVTRMLIDSHWLFEDERGHISYTSTGAIKAEDTNTITSVVGLHEIIKDLFIDVKKVFENSRPTDVQLENHLSTCAICADGHKYLVHDACDLADLADPSPSCQRACGQSCRLYWCGYDADRFDYGGHLGTTYVGYVVGVGSAAHVISDLVLVLPRLHGALGSDRQSGHRRRFDVRSVHCGLGVCNVEPLCRELLEPRSSPRRIRDARGRCDRERH